MQGDVRPFTPIGIIDEDYLYRYLLQTLAQLENALALLRGTTTGLPDVRKLKQPNTRPWSRPSASATQRPRSWPRGSTFVPRNARA